VSTDPYPLRTARLLLRPFADDDLDAVYDLQSRPDVTRYLLYDVRDRDQALAALQERIQAGRAGHNSGRLILALAVLLAETRAVIGDVALFWQSREHRQGEIGYVIHPDHAGHGYATEAARAMLDLGFDTFRLHRIVGRLDARNTASARVLEHLGLRREAHFRQNEFLKGEWTDEFVYAVLSEEWRSARPGRSA
jgi:RimJ/RimL family protein N-acetyltransferase